MKSVAKPPHGIAAGGMILGVRPTGGCVAAFAVGAALAAGTGIAQAYQPAARVGDSIRTPHGADRSSAVALNERVFGRRDLLGRLDLRAPTDFVGDRAPSDSGLADAAPAGLAAAPLAGRADYAAGPAPFPSARRPATSESADDRLPSLGRANSGVQIMSPAEEFARRFHREGLPLARLWKTRSAMLSLGLSPRGKPGIWLTQRIP
jgi:hypothetical protein